MRMDSLFWSRLAFLAVCVIVMALVCLSVGGCAHSYVSSNDRNMMNMSADEIRRSVP